MTDALHVVLDDGVLEARGLVVGTLFRERSRGQEVVSFEYDRDYLEGSVSVQLDPELPLHAGRIHSPSDRLFGVFRDSSPDRWGRVLMERREAQEANREERRPRRLTEWDFLAGVDDETRHGALRLQRPGDPPRYVDDRDSGVPPFAELRELQAVVRKLESDDSDEHPEAARWLAQVVAPGSSLGGARPKASIRAEDGTLWLAKFPSRDDRYDQAAWERLAGVLAARAGIPVPPSRLLQFDSRYRTFTVQRFDREASSRRMYASAMTLLCAEEGAKASYLEIAEALALQGEASRIERELAQLYRRVVFSLLIGNRDDHLRNHGFLCERGGWTLSPAFDLNPNPDKHVHALAIDDLDPTPSVENLRATRDFYRLTSEDALAIESEVRAAVSEWPEVASTLAVTKAEQRQLAAIIDSDLR